MRTLPDSLRRLVNNNDKDVRDALRKLRDPKETEATINSEQGKIVIKPSKPSKPPA